MRIVLLLIKERWRILHVQCGSAADKAHRLYYILKRMTLANTVNVVHVTSLVLQTTLGRTRCQHAHALTSTRSIHGYCGCNSYPEPGEWRAK